MPSLATYIYRFGNFNKAKKLAGLEEYEYIRYTNDELIGKLTEWAKLHDKSPSMNDINLDVSMPHVKTYINRFGSFNKAKELAELKTFGYTDDELIEKLTEWAKLHDKSPTARDIDEDKSMPYNTTYIRRFGSFNKAKELAGLKLFEYDSELNHVSILLEEWRKGRHREISIETLNGYLRQLKDLEDFLKENGKNLKEMTIMDVKNFILSIKERYSKNAMSQKFNAIRNFLKFFLRKAIIEKTEPLYDLSMIEYVDMFFKIQLRQMEDDSIEDEALSEEDVAMIKEKLKDYPLFDTMFRLDLNLGLRACEFVKIKVSEGMILNRKQARKGDLWIDLSRGILMIYRGKTRKPHLVALTSEMIQLVKKQLTLRKLYEVNHEFLFFSKTGKPLRKNCIFSYYSQISKIVGLKISSHKVRRTMATLLEKRGVPHSIIQRRMGHKAKDETQEYQRYPIRERQQILEENVGIL